MDVLEILKVVISFVCVTTLTILAERYISDKAAVVFLVASAILLIFLYRDDLNKAVNWSREHRPLAIFVCVLVFAAVGLCAGLWLTRPIASENSTVTEPSQPTKSVPSPTPQELPKKSPPVGVADAKATHGIHCAQKCNGSSG